MMFKKLHICLVVFLISYTIKAQHLNWEKLPSLPGAYLDFSQVDNSDSIWVHTTSGYYKSVDGKNWKHTNKIIASLYPYYTKLFWTSNGYCFSFCGAQLLRSKDSCTTWEDLSDSSFHQIYNYNIYETPAHAMFLLITIATDNKTLVKYSNDFGDSWGYLGNFPTSVNTAIYMANDSIIIASTNGVGIGPSLSSLNSPVLAYTNCTDVVSHTFKNGIQKVFVTTYGSGIQYTSDYGKTWDSIMPFQTTNFNKIWIDKEDRIFAFDYSGNTILSSDIGITWNIIGKDLYPYTICETNSGKVIIADYFTIFNTKSSKFENLSETFMEGPVSRICFRGKDVFINSDFACYQLINNTWKVFSDTLNLGQIGAGDNEKIYAVNFKTLITYESKDLVNWEEYKTPRPNNTTYSYNGEFIYKLNGEFRKHNFNIYDSIFKSVDAGKTWNLFFVKEMMPVYKNAYLESIVQDKLGNVYIVYQYGYGINSHNIDSIFVTWDNGKTFENHLSPFNHVSIRCYDDMIWVNNYYSTDKMKTWKLNKLCCNIVQISPYIYIRYGTDGIYIQNSMLDNGRKISDSTSEVYYNDYFFYLKSQNELELYRAPLLPTYTASEDTNKVYIIPNPSADILNLFTLNEFTNGTLKIYSIDGKLAGQYGYKGKSAERIDISNLSPGVYIVSVEDGFVIHTGKFVKI